MKTPSLIRRSWKTVPPGVRSALRDTVDGARELASKAMLWQWDLAVARTDACDIAYVGRQDCARKAFALLGLEAPRPEDLDLAAASPDRTVLVSEVPVHGALKVPARLRVVVPTDGEIKLKGPHRALAERLQVGAATADEDVAHIHHDLLVPYATARHGADAAHLDLATVQRLVAVGRLQVLRSDGQDVAARLCCPIERGGRRYWASIRAGYPQPVFSDGKLLGNLNLLNTWFGHHYARQRGFDAHDLGCSLARPDGGSLQWKRQRGGILDAWGIHLWFWITIPAPLSPEILWAWPLFSADARGLALNVGLPAARADDEVMQRFSRFFFRGLSVVRLHTHAGGEHRRVVDLLRRRYGDTPVETVVDVRSS